MAGLLADVYNNIDRLEAENAGKDKVLIDEGHTSDETFHQIWIFPKHITVKDVLSTLHIDRHKTSDIWYYNGKDRGCKYNGTPADDTIVKFVIDHDGWGWHDIDVFF